MKQPSETDALVERPSPYRPFYQQKAVCAPLIWLVFVVLAVLFLNPWSPILRAFRNDPISEILVLACFGLLFSLPLQCALWAAWGAGALKWRLAIGAVVAVALGILAGVADGQATVLILFAVLFTLFWAALALFRRSRGIRIQLLNNDKETGRAGFGIGYLLGLTAVVSVLASCCQLGLSREANLGPNALEFVISIVVVGLLILQSIFAWMLVMGTQQRLFIGLVGIPVMVIVVSYATTTVMNAIQPGPKFWEVCTIASGAVISNVGFGLALRLGGYRLAMAK